MKKLFFVLGSALCVQVSAQQVAPSQKDSTQVINLEQVMVKGVRIKVSSPVTFSSLSKSQIQKQNLGRDIPVMLNYLPNVIFTSDAGAGVGYTGVRVRGSDATRVNVTINGIPYNDAESQGTFWVNIPDFASSVESLQLQRGVGTSTNGTAAFGASLNMVTDAQNAEASAQIDNSFGSFNTLKHTVKLNTGKLGEHFDFSARLSKISSDGYIDRASSDLKSYFLQGTYSDAKTMLKALVFGGKEKTYQAWNGITQSQMKQDRRYNPAGAYTDANGKTQFYDNETDNYQQDHYQLHWNQILSPNWSSHIGLHYTHGEGYYQNYKPNEKYKKYAGLDPTIRSDLIRSKWLNNDFYGAVFSLNHSSEKWDFSFGGGINTYEGAHYGFVLWTKHPSSFNPDEKYYDNSAKKHDTNLYAKATYKINPKWQLFADAQYRHVAYSAEAFNVDDSFNFFNPKAGISYFLNPKNTLYFSYACAHREPNRDDYENNEQPPKPEQLNDFELGWRYLSNQLKINANLYYMKYKNQLVLTGKLDDVGSPIRSNSGKSFRAGIELDALWLISEKWQIRPNVSLSQNKNIDYFSEEEIGGVTSLKNYGDTQITYSPNVVAGNVLSFSPTPNWQLSLASKYVGSQYLNNTNSSNAKLDGYFVNDFIINWNFAPQKIAKSVAVSLQINNILNAEYASNGYFYEEIYYFPSATRNFLAGISFSL